MLTGFCPASFGEMFCSVVLCGADTHRKLLDSVVSLACFLTRGELEYKIAHNRSVVVLWMLFKIVFNPMHPLYGDLSVQLVSVLVKRCALITHRPSHRYTYAPPRCRTSQYRMTFIPLSVSAWNVFGDPVFDCVELAGFKTRSMLLFWLQLLACFLSSTVFPFWSFLL